MPYRFFDHTGDIGVDLWGGDLGELYAVAAEALTETLTDPECVRPRTRVTASLGASAPDLLLADWVSELIYRFDAFEWLTRRAHVTVAHSNARWTLHAQMDGETRDPARHPLKVLVKAVTYHELRVEQTAEGWSARMVLDI
ncbi:MAG TPA: archease [Vicinamibacterales bacterium]|nr:archease [Vicinamibacterales bacterium]